MKYGVGEGGPSGWTSRPAAVVRPFGVDDMNAVRGSVLIVSCKHAPAESSEGRQMCRVCVRRRPVGFALREVSGPGLKGVGLFVPLSLSGTVATAT